MNRIENKTKMMITVLDDIWALVHIFFEDCQYCAKPFSDYDVDAHIRFEDNKIIGEDDKIIGFTMHVELKNLSLLDRSNVIQNMLNEDKKNLEKHLKEVEKNGDGNLTLEEYMKKYFSYNKI